MLKGTIDKLFSKRKKKKESKRQFECYRKPTPVSSSSVESDQLDNELRSAKRFIQNYRRKILNINTNYANTQVSLNRLQQNLQEHKMHVNDAQSRQNLTQQTEATRQRKISKFNIGKWLKNVNKEKNGSPDQLRIYLDQSKNESNTHLNTRLHSNQRLNHEIDELNFRRMPDKRFELENYFKQNFCNCKNQVTFESDEKSDLFKEWNQIERLQSKSESEKITYRKTSSEQMLDDLARFSLTNYELVNQSSAEINELLESDEICRSKMQENSADQMKNRISSSLDLSYMNKSPQSSVHEILNCSNNEDAEEGETDDDQYLDTFTIESANTEDNPISTDQYTKLIKKLTYSDTMRLKLLKLCDQESVQEFEEEFSKFNYPQILNLDSGTFGVTFLTLDREHNLVVLKMIRTVSKNVQSRLNQLSYSGTETFDEVYNEVMISEALSSLHHSPRNAAHCFPKILYTKLVQGKIPEHFNIIKLQDNKLDLIQALTLEQFYYSLNQDQQIRRTKSTMMKDRQKFIKQEPFKLFPDAPIEYAVIAMKYVGKPLWKRLLNRQLTAQQLFGITQQLILGLACAEQQFNFEHRDLHISNVLIKRTKKSEVEFMINNQVYKLATYGYRCFVVDMTFSRLTFNYQVFYKDLSSVISKPCEVKNEKKIRTQEMVYQLMRDEIGDNWQKFRPRTNIHWLIYVLNTIRMCELFKKSNDQISKLLTDYIDHAGKCCDLNELVDYVVQRSS